MVLLQTGFFTHFIMLICEISIFSCISKCWSTNRFSNVAMLPNRRYWLLCAWCSVLSTRESRLNKTVSTEVSRFAHSRGHFGCRVEMPGGRVKRGRAVWRLAVQLSRQEVLEGWPRAWRKWTSFSGVQFRRQTRQDVVIYPLKKELLRAEVGLRWFLAVSWPGKMRGRTDLERKIMSLVADTLTLRCVQLI